MRFEKSSVVVAMAIAMALVTGLAFAAHGASEEALRSIIRWSARFSVSAFLLAFLARPLRQLWSSSTSGWLLRNRRHLGVSFALAHFTHLGAIAGIAIYFPEPFRGDLDVTALLGGGYCYLLIGLMALTSTDTTAAWLSRKNWRRLHTHGMHVIWLIFALSYIPRALIEDPVYSPAALGLVLALGVRVWAWFRARASQATAAPAN